MTATKPLIVPGGTFRAARDIIRYEEQREKAARNVGNIQADYSVTVEAQRRMNKAVSELSQMAPDVAVARQIKEFSDDRKKRAFSVLVVSELNSGKSVSAAEHFARATDSWGAQLNDLGEQYKSAIRVLENYEAAKTQYEAARSVLSLEKEKIRL